MIDKSIAIVGSGNFAINLEALCTFFGIKVDFVVDEFRQGDFLGVPVYRAAQLDPAKVAAVGKFVIAISHPAYSSAAVERLAKRGISRQRIISLNDDSALQILRLLFEQFGEAAAAAFLSAGVTSVPGLEKLFLQESWERVLNAFDPQRKTIGLGYYGRGGGFRKHISPLIPVLAEKFNVVSMSDELMGQAEEAPRHLYMSTETACSMECLDLVVSAHVFPCGPPQVPRVTFSHVIYDFNLTEEYHAARIAESETHYLYASSQPCFEWYQRLIKEYRLRNRICVIPGGYLQLDRNIELAQSYTGPCDSIIYAPTLSLAEYPHCELATSICDGPEIVLSLLQKFPDFTVIFRPHPSDLKLFQLNREDVRSKQFSQLMELCREHPRCELDDNATNYMGSYNRSALMISDSSSTAFSFAFATGRPVVFFSSRNAELIATLGGRMKFVKDRGKVGSVAESISELIKQAERFLYQPNEGREDVQNFRNRMVFNLGRSAHYFAENIGNILSGEKHPDWYYSCW